MPRIVKSVPREHAFKFAARAIKFLETGFKALTSADSEFTHVEFDDNLLKVNIRKGRNEDYLNVFDLNKNLVLEIHTYIPSKKFLWIFDIPRPENTDKGPLVVEVKHTGGYEVDINEKSHMKRIRRDEKLTATAYSAYYMGGAAIRRPVVKVSADATGAFVEIG